MRASIVGECESVATELAAGELGDRRLDARRDRLIERLTAHPDRGFPALCDDDAEVEALYRFLRNPRVSPERLLAPHVAATEGRCAAAGEVWVVHDTTDMVFAGEGPRAGLTRLPGGRHGFVVHATLAVAADGTRAPLGVLRLHPWVRPTPRPGKRDADRFKAADKESLHWRHGVAAVRTALGGTSIVHVMDRAADSYELLADWVAHGDRFIVRLTHDRVVEDAGRLSAALAEVPTVCQRDVPLARRADRHRTLSDRTRHPARASRVATLRIAGRAVALHRPPHAPGPATLTVHVVVVEEVGAPTGTEPVRWWLATTEPIATAAHLLRIVDGYRARWLIRNISKRSRPAARIKSASSRVSPPCGSRWRCWRRLRGSASGSAMSGAPRPRRPRRPWCRLGSCTCWVRPRPARACARSLPSRRRSQRWRASAAIFDTTGRRAGSSCIAACKNFGIWNSGGSPR